MGRRIEVELTSTRDDGTWTWRAAGAKQPKGVVDAGLLYEGARVGDVVRAEADFEIEGITITAILPPQKKRDEPSRLEIIGPPREHQGVTSSLVPKSDRPRERGRGRDREWDGGQGGGRPDRRPGGGPGAGAGRPERRPGAGDQGRGGPSRPREGGPGRPAGPRPERRPRPEGAEDGRREDRRPSRPRDGARAEGRGRPTPPPAEPAAPKPKRLAPANVHRAAVLETLPPEQRPIAEQVLRGGIPAVRQAIETQNARLKEEGQQEVHPGPLMALAEQLLPQLKAAEWRDRAEAAAKVVDEVSLRDLRSVVAGADAARDDEGRLLAGTLRQALERRVTEHRDKWVTDVAGALDEGRLVRALRLSAHPPDPASRFPADLAVRLSEAAGAAMTPDATPDRWATLLDAVAESPVRRTVKPVGLPAEPGEPLLQAARQASGRVPALAAMLGIAMPPPPGPPRAGRPAPRAGRAPGQPAARRRPPPPPGRPHAPASETPEAPTAGAAGAPTTTAAAGPAPEPSGPGGAAVPGSDPVPAAEVAPAPADPAAGDAAATDVPPAPADPSAGETATDVPPAPAPADPSAGETAATAATAPADPADGDTAATAGEITATAATAPAGEVAAPAPPPAPAKTNGDGGTTTVEAEAAATAAAGDPPAAGPPEVPEERTGVRDAGGR
ncbi:MAG: hypothetical protein ACT4PX_08850 [Actinomycetota bacterium]